MPSISHSVSSQPSPPGAATQKAYDTTQRKSQHLSGWFLWVSLGGILLFILGDDALLSILPSNDAQYYNETVQCLGYAVATVCFGWSAVHAKSRRLQIAWALIGVGFLTNVIAEVIYAYLELGLQIQNPFPSVADAFYLMFYPLVAAGVLALPSRITNVAQRIRVFLDASIITTATLALSVYWLIGPTFLGGGDSTLSVFVGVAYPVGDLLILAALIALLLSGITDSYRAVYLWLIAGMIGNIYADSLYTYLSLQGTYAPGTQLTDPFWPASSLMMSVAPLVLLIMERHSVNGSSGVVTVQKLTQADGKQSSVVEASRPAYAETIGRIFFPYASLFVVAVLLVVTWPTTPPNSLFPVFETLGFFLIAAVVTRQILTFRDLISAQTTAEQMRQLDDLKDQFISNVNHELRTPLMTLQTYTNVLRLHADALTQARRDEISRRIADEVDSLVGLTQSLLDARQIEHAADAFEPCSVSVRDALEGAIKLLDPREASDTRDLHITIAPDLHIWGDPIRLRQILTNLLSNALKYSAPRSPIEVTALIAPMRVRRTNPLALLNLMREEKRTSPPASMVEISIRDYGLGIPAEQIPLLFNRFVRLPRDLASTVVGNGLGLYLCRILAEQMRGSIQVTSAGVEGEGATFTLHLPTAPTHGAANQTHDEPNTKGARA